MNRKQPHNLSASIRHRLLDLARARGEEFQLTLTQYAAERLLYRLSQSAHREKLILKGAMLFKVWTGAAHRPTRDLDFLGFGDPKEPALIDLFRDLCQQAVPDDGLLFAQDTIKGTSIREHEQYRGVRITLRCFLGVAEIPIQVDIGFGDAVTPAPQNADVPVLLEFPQPQLRIYPQETVIAEKCEAMVKSGLLNSRLKDFFDLHFLARHFDFDGSILIRALSATFSRRGTSFPHEVPPALTAEYYNDSRRQVQWRSFLQKCGSSTNDLLHLPHVMEHLIEFLMPPLQASYRSEQFDLIWLHEGSAWKPRR